MADETVTRRRKATLVVPDYQAVSRGIHHLKCTLACASIALGKAQDTSDIDLAAKAWWVINDCMGDLERFANDLDGWYMHHNHSPKEGEREHVAPKMKGRALAAEGCNCRYVGGIHANNCAAYCVAEEAAHG